MKVTAEHRELLRSRITPLDTPEVREAYREGRYPRAELTQDVNKRYRWDLLWASKAYSEIWDAGYNDAHIDTALRSLVSAL